MNKQERNLQEFLERLEQQAKNRQKQLYENPEIEQNRLKWIEFRRTVEIKWVPILEEYLTVLGMLWFGDVMRLKGSFYRKGLVPSPAYSVAYEFFGPMAVFWVQEHEWQEREVPFGERTELRIEIFRKGYRCRIVLEDNEEYHFQGDNHGTLIQFDDGTKVDRDSLADIFAEAYLVGPQIIHNRWKEIEWPKPIE